MAIQAKTVAPNLTQLRTTQTASKPQASTESSSLGSTFEKMLGEVNNLQLESEAKQTEFLTTQKKDIHGTMVAMEKAEVSLKLLLQVRSKLTAAYEEISRMQV